MRYVWLLAAASLELTNCSQGGPGGAVPGTGGGEPTTTGGDVTTASGGDGTLESACNEYQAAFCARMGRCRPVILQSEYGDEASCRSRWAHQCEALVALAGVRQTRECYVSRAAAERNASCWDNPVDRTSCAVPGSLADGEPCAIDEQCAGGECQFEWDPAAHDWLVGCGVCTTSTAVDWSCGQDGECATGKHCVVNWEGYGHCVSAQPEGADCSQGSAYCEKGLVCDGTKCARPLMGGVGASCTYNIDCDESQKVVCSTAGQAGQCRAASFANAGQSCQSAAICVKGDCVYSTSSKPATCVGYAEDGAPCDPGNRQHCLTPASCIDGICKSADQIQCP
jgi:hypothetical protein